MSGRSRSGPWRLPGLLVVVLALVLAGVANAEMQPRQATHRGSFRPGEQAVVLASSRVRSSAWYCPGPLPLGPGRGAASISVANLGAKTVHGRLVVASSTGTTRVAPIVVSSHAQGVYGLTHKGARAEGAVTVLVDSAAVGVEELVHGATGPMVAPCADQTARHQELPVGSTHNADNVSLALYDPGATPAVVSVSFATSTGPSAPPAFQGIDVGPGKLVVLDVGHDVASRVAVATLVSSTGGRVVAGALVRSLTDRSLLGALVSASPVPARRWAFPAAPLGGSARQSFSVLNPTKVPAHVVLRLSGQAAGGQLAEVVPPKAVVSLTPGAASATATPTAAILTASGAPVVAARELQLASPAEPRLHRVRRARTIVVKRAGRRVRRRQVVTETVPVGSPLTTLPGLPTGFSASSGTIAPYRRWLLASGESDAHVSEVVTVTNPGRRVAHVRVERLTGSLAAPETALAVAPGSTATLSIKALPSLKGAIPLAVESDAPVLAGELLYATGAHPVGLAALAGIPIR